MPTWLHRSELSASENVVSRPLFSSYPHTGDKRGREIALVSGESIPSPIFTLCKRKSMARRLKTPNGHEVDKTGRSPHVYRLNQQTVPDG